MTANDPSDHITGADQIVQYDSLQLHPNRRLGLIAVAALMVVGWWYANPPPEQPTDDAANVSKPYAEPNAWPELWFGELWDNWRPDITTNSWPELWFGELWEA